mgnify:CR=1 FL=1
MAFVGAERLCLTGKKKASIDDGSDHWFDAQRVSREDQLSKFSIPIFLMEPISVLQKISENMQYCELLDKACDEEEESMMDESDVSDSEMMAGRDSVGFSELGDDVPLDDGDDIEVKGDDVMALLEEVDGEDGKFESYMKQFNFQRYVLKLRAKADTWNEQTRVKVSIAVVKPCDYKAESAALVQALA